MGRPPKKKVRLTQESFIQLTQEAYNELVEQRSVCIRTINENKKKIEVEDMHDLAGMNKANTDLLKIIDNTIDKKMGIIKLMGQYVLKKDQGTESSDGGDLSNEDMGMLRDMLNDATIKGDGGEGDIKYDI